MAEPVAVPRPLLTSTPLIHRHSAFAEYRAGDQRASIDSAMVIRRVTGRRPRRRP
ncbi:hypothetical protein TIFTF001_006125 [Ficus carica]|uniref:Uncharacterized protein n=1 Tax=Ficus carica TaxID=3494 RepID=A0AA88A3H7_FICCA|nr:hypothetical protein TIFTF001_006125 [Ficus carica]